MKKILVTGAAGYIGSTACYVLSQAGYLPVGLDNLQRGHRQLVQFGPFESVDLTDPVALDSVFKRHEFEGILHFAGWTLVGESLERPTEYYRNNVVASCNLVEIALRHDVRNIVFSSTCATYGTPQTEQLCETHPQLPINPYGQTKLVVERYLQDVSLAHGAACICLRYFNAAGAVPDQGLGEWHDPETHLIPRAILCGLTGDTLDVFGSDYPTPDGTCVRDYVHVADLARAHLLALERNNHNLARRSASWEAYNLGSCQGFSVLEVVRTVESELGQTVPVRLLPRRSGDPSRLVADSSAAHQILGWSPQCSSLGEIVKSAVRWHRAQTASAGVYNL